MTEIVLQIAATKLVLSIALAVTVWVIQQRTSRPDLTHVSWLLVLGVILIPAVVPLRVLPEEVVVQAAVPPDGSPLVVANTGVSGDSMAFRDGLRQNGKPLAALAWLVGSAGFFGWTLVRTVRFQRTLSRAAWPAPQLQRLATEIGEVLGLPRVPQIHTTRARLRPMVWWAGGRVRVLIPAMFLAELDETELRAVLAHELAHVRRRDYLVRIVEWLACSAFWWNPVVWWARRELRLAEESCCDVLAVSGMKSTRGRYAKSLLRVVEVMSAAPVRRAPALASAAHNGRQSRQLEKRLRMVLGTVAASPDSLWLSRARGVALASGLSLGLVYCGTAKRLVGPKAGPSNDATGLQAMADAPADEYAWSLFNPDTVRGRIVIWAPGSASPRPILLTPARATYVLCKPGAVEGWVCPIVVPEDLLSFNKNQIVAFLAGRNLMWSDARYPMPHTTRLP
jgi:beta-lactamase regulating signal transducer with metallopeptidase domain